MISRMWKSRDLCQLVDSVTGKTMDLYFPFSHLYDATELEELLISEVESFTQTLKTYKPTPPFSKSDQHALGEVLTDIVESNKQRKDTGNRKYTVKE